MTTAPARVSILVYTARLISGIVAALMSKMAEKSDQPKKF